MTEQYQDAPQEPVDATDAVDTADATEIEDTPAPESEDTGGEAVTAEPSQQARAPVKNWSDADEQEARLFGWKSPDEWKGDKPSGYIDDPSEYLQRVQRSRIFQTMQEKMTEQERKLAAMNDMALKRQKQDHERQLAMIAQRQRQAVAEADTEAWDALERQRGELMRNAPQDAPPQQPQAQEPAQEVVRYREENEWAKDPVIWHELSQAVDLGLKTGALQTSDPKAQLEFAERSIRTRYPHLFEAQKPSQPVQRVDGGGLAGGPKSGRGQFDKLPSEAKTAFQRFVKQGIYADDKESRESYAREYNAS